MESRKTPQQFLEEMGIEMQKTTLVVCIDGIMRQPYLPDLMNQYANYVLDCTINSNTLKTEE